MTDLDTITCADALTYLRGLPDECVNCIVTSPPYFGLRDYQTDGQIGREPTPGEYVAGLVEIFREARRVLRDDGTCWINLGDSFANDGKWGGSSGGKHVTALHGDTGIGRQKNNTGLPPKSLIGIPWRVAFGLQDDGWILRSDIIWAKPNPMPESVTDRPTKAHEYIFLFAKSPRYWYDAAAVAEESTGNLNGGRQRAALRGTFEYTDADYKTTHVGNGNSGLYATPNADTRNRRTVWTINPASFKGAHFATFPEEIPEICIKAGCPEWCCDQCGAPWVAQVERESDWQARKANGAAIRGSSTNGQSGVLGRGPGVNHDMGTGRVTHHGYAPSCACNAGKRPGVVLDMFMGAGTVGLVAKRLNRRYLGCDLNPDYVRMALQRVQSIPYTLFSLMEATGE